MHTAKDLWNTETFVTLQGCPLCGSSHARFVTIRADGLRLNVCQQCGLAYINPRPDSAQIVAYYDSNYFTGNKDFFQGKDYFEERDQQISRGDVTGYREIVSIYDVTNKDILDIGCASGALLQALKPHSPHSLVGIDLAEDAILYGQKTYGLDLRLTTLEMAEFADAQFDLIIMIDLIEHMENLPTFSKELYRILKSDGALFLVTPNFDGFNFGDNNWTCLVKDFEHLHYFNAESIKFFANQWSGRVIHLWSEGIPVKLVPYPQLLPLGLHRLRYPQISLKNNWTRFKYKQALRASNQIGHNLCAMVLKI